MTLENYLAEAGALAGLAGVLAGFSLAAVVQLLTAANGSRLVTAGIVFFSEASVWLVGCVPERRAFSPRLWPLSPPVLLPMQLGL